MATNELQEGLDAILEEKQNYIVPQNIKSGVEILGVEGAIVDGGVDTTDANAIAEDLSFGKTAYVNGEKITGTSDTNISYNVKSQIEPPENPVGVWIKSNVNIDRTYFSADMASSGVFINGNYSFLNQTEDIIGNAIAGDYMYVFGKNSSTSFKYDLKRGIKVGNINVPNADDSAKNDWVGNRCGAIFCPSVNKIYVCYGIYHQHNSNWAFGIYSYDITNDTYKQINVYYGSSYGSLSGSWLGYYNGYVYILNKYDGARVYKIDVMDDKVTYFDNGSINTSYINTQGYQSGKYIYGIYYSGVLYRYDISANTVASRQLDRSLYNTYGSFSRIVVKGNKCFLFFSGSKNIYVLYDWDLDSYELVETAYSYNISGGSYYNVARNDADGTVYFHSPSTDTYVFRVSDYDVSDLLPNSAIVTQDLTGSNLSLIESKRNLTIGIKDAYTINNSSDLGNYMVCYGDGKEWHVVKNPTGETYLAYFDCVGGSSIDPQINLCGRPIIKPSNPSKYHYLFKEWLYDGKPYNWKKPFVFDTTLTATWNDAYVVTYDYDDGTSVDDTVLPNTKTTKPAVDPVKEWKEFLGWSLNGEPFDFNTPITEDITLTPIWGTVEEVDYIYSTGTQYIDTDIIPTGNTKVEMDCRIASSWGTTEYTPIFGIRDTASSPTAQYCAYFLTANTRRLHYPHGSVSPTASVDSQYDLTDRNTIICSPTSMYLNDELILEVSKQTFTARYSMLLFAMGNWYGTNARTIDDRKPGITMYNCKVYEGETLIAEFIPAKGYDGDFLLYDRIRKKVYRNKGTRKFFGPGKTWEQVSYIQSTGTQYVNTYLKVSNIMDYEIDFEFLKTTDYGSRWVPLIGYQSTNSSSSNKMAFWINSETRKASINYYSSDSTGSGSTALTGRHLLRNMDNKFYIDGSLVYTANTGTFTGVDNVCIFCVNQNNSYNCQLGWTRVYGAKIYGYNNVVVRDYVPAKDENDRPCLYDKVSGDYLYNSGTGEFVLPPVSEEYTPLDYLQTTGLQWFDLGALASNTIKIEMKYNQKSGTMKNDSSLLMGGRNSDGSYAFLFYSSFNRNEYNKAFHFYSSKYESTNWTHSFFDEDVVFTIDKSGYSFVSQSDSKSVTISNSNTFTANASILIGNGNVSTGAANEDNATIMKLYYCKLYRNNSLIANFIPVKDPSNIICLYDTISKTYLYNKGRGALLDHDVTFTDVNYIDTYGQGAFNTYVNPTNNTKVEIKSRLFKDSHFDAALFGSRNTSTTNNRMGIFFNGYDGNVNYTPYMGATGNISNPHSLRYDTDYVFTLDSTGVYIDGVKVNDISAGTFTSSNPLYLFGLNENNNLDWRKFIGRTYYCKIWENNVLVRNFVPKKDENGIVFMYDTVNSKCYYLTGGIYPTSGLPNGFTQVPYIRNVTGDCVINTEFIPNNKTRMVVTEEAMTWNPWHNVFGASGPYNPGTTTREKMFFMECSDSRTKVNFAFGKNIGGITISDWITPHIIDFNRNYVKLNNSSVTITDNTFNSEGPACLFCSSNTSLKPTTFYVGNTKIFASSIYDDGVLVRNLIPCYRNSDERTGMYDTLNNIFYYNCNYAINGHEFYYGLDDYDELQYLEGGKGQYIDTGYKPNQNTRTDLQLYGTDASGYWLGAWDVAYNNKAYAICNDNGSVYVGYGNQGGNYGSQLSNAKHTVLFVTNTLYIDGSSFKTLTANTFQLAHNLYLFAQNRIGTPFTHPNRATNIKMKDVRFIDNSIVRKYFIPMIRKLDGKVGMYDVINNVFHTNEGVGEFKYQEQGKALFEYKEIEYIQSSGTQYINTGVLTNSNTNWEIEYKITGTPEFATVIGNNKHAYGIVYQNNPTIKYFYSGDWVGGSFDCNIDDYNNRTFAKFKNKTLIINDGITTYTHTTDYDPIEFSDPLYLCALLRVGSVVDKSFCKLYSCRIWDGETLIRDYQPIQILATQEYALLDKVSGKIYRNVGTGKFTGSGYEPVRLDYIQSTASSSNYINTLVPGNKVGRIDFDMYVVSKTTGSWQAFLYVENNGSPYNGMGVRVNTVENFSVQNSYAISPTITVTANTRYKLKYDAINGEGTINGTEFYSYSTSDITSYNVYIFGTNVANGSSASQCNMQLRLYHMKIYDRDYKLIRDFVPCVDTSNVVCLYDKVENKYYYAYSGSFNYGSIIYDDIDETEATTIGNVINQVLGISSDTETGGYDSDVDLVLDDILGGAI